MLYFLLYRCSLIFAFVVWPLFVSGQQVANVPEAFSALSPDPKIILVENSIDVPTDRGHFQGVQVIDENGSEKLLISGSSLTTAYVLKVDLATRKSEKLISLMQAPFRHAGGIQVSEPYMVVGIEDNFVKTASKVCLFNYMENNLLKAAPSIVIDRQGEPEQQTAGATGLLPLENDFMVLVSNWDSRNWDFYHINLEKKKKQLVASFTAPDNWPGYQAINLIADNQAIYAIGLYKKEDIGYADLIFVSKRNIFELALQKVDTKPFNCAQGVDFGAAAGLQVDLEGKLHIWGTQKDASEQITINKFSQY